MAPPTLPAADSAAVVDRSRVNEGYDEETTLLRNADAVENLLAKFVRWTKAEDSRMVASNVVVMTDDVISFIKVLFWLNFTLDA
mmetsp:Transcript_49439/g.91970  ORF Transcript_49439/g.91970 Transcript_49439/m.91970 type:complete len:84 (+) Transcript_49439:1983-2234(+)